MTHKPHLVRLGRIDGTANKTLFIHGKREALAAANSLSFVLFGRHDFKCADCHDVVRVEQDGFYVEHIAPESPMNHAH